LEMPGANAPVQLARIPPGELGGFAALVRFPPGWSRPASGYYDVEEQFVLIEGDLGFNGTIWREGDSARIAARRVRAASHSQSGCLALAWFAAPPRWIPGEPAEDANCSDSPDAPQARRLLAIIDAA
jgi:hypothetical protein